MNKEIYLHAIYARSNTFDSITSLKILKKILKSNALLSSRLQNKKHIKPMFNGFDYISLCDYEKKDCSILDRYNSYEGYIKYSLSLIFPKDKIDAIIPTLVDISKGKNYYYEMEKFGLSETIRYTDMADEVQVKDRISLDLMTGITLPLSKMTYELLNEEKNTYLILKEIEQIEKLLNKYNKLVPIYDIDSFESLDNEETVKYLVREYKNRG